MYIVFKRSGNLAMESIIPRSPQLGCELISVKVFRSDPSVSGGAMSTPVWAKLIQNKDLDGLRRELERKSFGIEEKVCVCFFLFFC